jgi:hypothetical protein
VLIENADLADNVLLPMIIVLFENATALVNKVLHMLIML